MKLCCICSKPLHTEKPVIFYCSTCFALWNHDIKAKVPWVEYCRAEERHRRYIEKKEFGVLFYGLGTEFDLEEGSRNPVQLKNEEIE